MLLGWRTTITCSGLGSRIRAPALTIGLVVPSSKSSEVVHQHQEPDHVRALFLQRRWEGSVRDRFRTLKALRRSWKRRIWRRLSTFRRLGGAPFCLFLERGILEEYFTLSGPILVVATTRLAMSVPGPKGTGSPHSDGHMRSHWCLCYCFNITGDIPKNNQLTATTLF